MSGTDKMAENISSSEELLDFLKRRARKHNNLKTYGAYDNIRPIVEEGVLRLSNGEKWNDKLDSSIFQQKAMSIFNSESALHFQNLKVSQCG